MKPFEIEIGGKTRKVHLTMWGLRLAKTRHGYDTQAFLNRLSRLDQGDEVGAEEMLDLLWIACLPDDEDMSLRDFMMAIPFGDLGVAGKAIERVFAEQVTAEFTAEAKGSGSKKK